MARRKAKRRSGWSVAVTLLAIAAAALLHWYQQETAISLEEVPPYSGAPYVELNGNLPDFSADELSPDPFEVYSPLDLLGRCGTAYANIGRELMPTEDRGDIGQIHPSGWQSVKYDIVDGGYLYNRCHLIGYQLTGENANEENLITGTRYLNVEGMLPFEDQVAEYVEETGCHVLYRVTPVYQGDNLLASGVVMEAESVEDDGAGVRFCVHVYNVQPGVEIDYATGESWLAEEEPPAETASGQAEGQHYVLNTRSMKFHLPECSGVATMSESNRQDYTGSRQALLDQGYSPCGTCNP